MEGQLNMVLWSIVALAVAGAGGFLWVKLKRVVYLNLVRHEMKKEKQWLRRGEYNAAMVKGRQNLELLLKLAAEYHGIEIDNTAQAVNVRGEPMNGKMNRGRRRQRVMTNQQFCWYLDEKGYLDRVAKWELNQIRIIGNKAVHENFSAKDEAWNQYTYLEDILKVVTEEPPKLARRPRAARRTQTDEAQNIPRKKKKSTPQAEGNGRQNGAKAGAGQPVKKGTPPEAGAQPQKKKTSESGKRAGGPEPEKQSKQSQTPEPGKQLKQLKSSAAGKQPEQQKILISEKQQSQQKMPEHGKQTKPGESGKQLKRQVRPEIEMLPLQEKQPGTEIQSKQQEVAVGKQSNQQDQRKKTKISQPLKQQEVLEPGMLPESGQQKKRAEKRKRQELYGAKTE